MSIEVVVDVAQVGLPGALGATQAYALNTSEYTESPLALTDLCRKLYSLLVTTAI